MKVRKILCENERTSVDPSLSGNGAQVLNSIVDRREGLQPSTSRQSGGRKISTYNLYNTTEHCGLLPQE